MNASAHKKRLSMMPGTSSASRPSMAGLPQRNNPPPQREPATPAVSELMRSTRRSMAFGRNPRQSSFGLVPQTPMAPMHTRDPRPVRDRHYQQTISQQIYEYLVTNHFEQETRHPLNQRTLSNPTQKDFKTMFEWIFRRIDPGYPFHKSIENEVHAVLRAAKYPWLDSITKSQIVAVGGQSWAYFLGMLHWMVELNTTIEKYHNHDYSGDDGPSLVDEIFNRHARESYFAYLQGDDRFARPDAELCLAEENAEFQEILAEQRAQNPLPDGEDDELDEELARLEAKWAKIEEAKVLGKNLADDIVKLGAFVDARKEHNSRYSTQMSQATQEENNVTDEIEALGREKLKLQQAIKDQGLSPAELDKLHLDMERQQKALTSLDEIIDEGRQVVSNKESTALAVFDALDRVIKEYTSSVLSYNAWVASDNDLPEIPESVYLIDLREPLSEENLGRHPSVILGGVDPRNQIRPEIVRICNMVTSKVKALQEDALKLQEEIENNQERLVAQKRQIGELEAKSRRLRETRNALEDSASMNENENSQNTERLENQFVQAQSETAHAQSQHKGLLVRLQDAEHERNKLTVEIQQARERLSLDILKQAEVMVGFKAMVQMKLQDFEMFVKENVEEEIQEHQH
ncbi:putative kinetochore protein [Yarrowia sp. B02]|nr:putative kinetochore protein [Yarrowia sp. B02]